MILVLNKRVVALVAIVIAMLGVTSIVIASHLSVSKKYHTVSEEMTLLDFKGRFAAPREEDLGILLEREGEEEDSVTFPFVFNPIGENYTVKGMLIAIAGHTLVQESACTFVITLNDQINQTVNDYIDESAVSWFSIRLDSEFYDAVEAGINTITLHGYEAENGNFLLYQVFLYIEYQYSVN